MTMRSGPSASLDPPWTHRYPTIPRLVPPRCLVAVARYPRLAPWRPRQRCARWHHGADRRRLLRRTARSELLRSGCCSRQEARGSRSAHKPGRGLVCSCVLSIVSWRPHLRWPRGFNTEDGLQSQTSRRFVVASNARLHVRLSATSHVHLRLCGDEEKTVVGHRRPSVVRGDLGPLCVQQQWPRRRFRDARWQREGRWRGGSGRSRRDDAGLVAPAWC
jgi:hypothetical protein